MREEIQIRTVTVEMLRPGPAHNQLLSPLTQYLGICDDSEAGIVTQPYEHAAFLRRMAAMRYESGDGQADRLSVLRELGVEMARILGLIPRLPGALTADPAGPDTLIHLRLVLSASELAALPFELAKVPIGPNAHSESWLSLQARVPVVITRRTRNVSTAGVKWPMRPRVLFISANPEDVPYEEHREALINAVAPFRSPGNPDCSADGRREQYGDWLTIWKDACFEDVVEECKRFEYTHIHILAHGKEENSGEESSFGLELGSTLISAERLASAFTGIVNGVKRCPAVVTLATCDSGNVGSVIVPGASIAHVLHQAGIPLVLASQVPLSKEGSKVVVGDLYRGLLWAENPWVLLHHIRTTLHGLLAARSHDWASLVVYEALPTNLSAQLEEARYYQSLAAIKVALKAVEGTTVATSDYEKGVAAVTSLLEKLPTEGAYEMECLGQRASALKKLAEIEFKIAKQAAAAQQDAHVRKSCLYLDQALHHYERAVDGFLVNREGQAVQRLATMHWVLAQQLCLSAVLSRQSPEGAMEAAIMSAKAYLEHPDLEQRAWAHGTLAELTLLKLAIGGAAEAEGDTSVCDQIRVDLRGLIRLARRLDSKFIIDSTERQFRRYVDWWSTKLCEDVVLKLDLDDGLKGYVPSPTETESYWEKLGIGRIASEMVEMLAAANQSLDAGQTQAVPFTERGMILEAREPAPSLKPSAAEPSNPVLSAPATLTAAPAQGKPGSATKIKPKTSAAANNDAFLSIEMLPAGHGDCLWIEYGRGAETHRVLVDCGPAGAYRDFLKARIERQAADQRGFELFILSHIDDDHIGGGIPFLKDAESLGVSFGDVWFNGWKHLAPFADLGAKQGEMFSALLLRHQEQNRLQWNAWQKEKAIVLPRTGALPECTLPGGMRLTLLSPSIEKLKDLAPAWKKAVEKEGMVPGDRMAAEALLGGGRETDSTDVKELADAEFHPDAAENNGSSIAVLAEYEGKRVLLGADAHAPLLVDSLRRLLKKGEKLKLDAFKLPHHGSQNNLNKELLQMVDCGAYLVSTNGDRFKHPDRQAIGRVIHYGGDRPRLYFNYESKFNAVWKSPELQRTYGYEAIYPADANAPGLIVRL